MNTSSVRPAPRRKDESIEQYRERLARLTIQRHVDAQRKVQRDITKAYGKRQARKMKKEAHHATSQKD